MPRESPEKPMQPSATFEPTRFRACNRTFPDWTFADGVFQSSGFTRWLGLPIPARKPTCECKSQPLRGFPLSARSAGVNLIALLAVVATALLNTAEAANQKPPRPNIVILFADDLGYSDIGCFGGEIDTPHLDKLAGNGVRLTQFYNTARCCPARASLLTGLYPHQAGIGMMVYRDYGEGYEGNLNSRCVTFGEVLKTAGYRTLLTGKWHAGHQPHARPEVRGFDQFTGVYPHIDSYWKVLKGCDIYRDKKLFIAASEDPINPYNPEEEFYTTDFFTDAALDYIDQASKDTEKPFVLYVPYNVPHFPIEAPDDLIEKYQGRYSQGWDTLREEKLARMKQLGIVGKDQKLPRVHGFGSEERPGFHYKPKKVTEPLPRWDSLSEEDRRELEFRRAIYAAQVDRLDQNVGRIIKRLETLGILDNTLILFFSDNGCSGELDHFGMNWGKYTRSNYSEWRKKGGWSISQGQCWASYSNTPFRKFKIFTYEGGVASSFIAHWPNGIKNPGRIVGDQAFHLIDIMPTLCEVTGAKYPSTYNGRKITPAQGKSLVPVLTSKSSDTDLRTLYWQHETQAAIREGKWKLVSANDRDDSAWELYDLSSDRSETDNLRSRHPEIASRLKDKWEIWAKNANVLPFPETRGNMKRVPWPPAPWPKGSTKGE